MDGQAYQRETLFMAAVVRGRFYPLIALALAQSDIFDPQAIAAYQEIEKIVGEETWMVFLVTMPSHWTWNTEKIGGTPTFSPWDGSINFQSIYVKKS